MRGSKKWEKFLQRDSLSHFLTKNIGVFEILAFEILTKRWLTPSFVLNNGAQMSVGLFSVGLDSLRIMIVIKDSV